MSFTLAQIDAGASSRSNRSSSRFIKGPLPFDWIALCAHLPGHALHVGLALWYLVGLRKTTCIVCSYRVFAELGVKRHSAYRALKALERAGLIYIQRGPGRCPRVTLFRVVQSCSARGLELQREFDASTVG